MRSRSERGFVRTVAPSNLMHVCIYLFVPLLVEFIRLANFTFILGEKSRTAITTYFYLTKSRLASSLISIVRQIKTLTLFSKNHSNNPCYTLLFMLDVTFLRTECYFTRKN